MDRYKLNSSSPAGSTCSSILGRGRRFGVKNGINPEDGVSSLEPSSAVNPMDCSRYVCISVPRRRIPLTPLATLRLITASRPTKAPLSMNSTFDVSIWYISGFAEKESGTSEPLAREPTRSKIRVPLAWPRSTLAWRGPWTFNSRPFCGNGNDRSFHHAKKGLLYTFTSNVTRSLDPSPA